MNRVPTVLVVLAMCFVAWLVVAGFAILAYRVWEGI